MAYLEQEGTYTAECAGSRVKKKDSGAVCISIKYHIMAQAIDGEWADLTDRGLTIWGDHYIIGKDEGGNKLNEKKQHELMDAFGWDGKDFVAWDDGSESEWVPKDVQIVVKNDTFNGKTRLRVDWVNPYDYVHTPGEGTSFASADVGSLAQQYGASLRASAAAHTAEAGPAQTPPPAPAGKDGDELPF